MKLKVYMLVLSLLFISSCRIKSRNQPQELSGKIETIKVEHINWACDCANFIETTYYANPGYETKEEDCIFIEPSQAQLKIPDSYYINEHFTYFLKLRGQYYIDKGVPDSYEQKTELKPEKARVFRYDSFELVKK